jgi:hypothetical protein
MNHLLEAARQLQTLCEQQGWRSCLIGGLAVQRWGQPRVTLDVDLSLLTGFGREDEFIDVLLQSYTPRMGNAAEFARRKRVLLLQTSAGVGIDVSFAALPFEELVIRRASDYSYPPGITLRTCSLEDLVVLKLFASRPIDIHDAEGVIIRHKKKLNWKYIEEQLRPLVELKEEPEILDTLARLRKL